MRVVRAYASLRAAVCVEIEERKSRFIALAAPVESAAAAEEQIARARATYPDATHHCFAYRAGLEGTVVRMSDAGEPQGTAGKPILDVIERSGLENTCIVVVRYFGGIKLGAGGLTRAYRAAAAAAVERAGIAEYVPHTLLAGVAPYDAWSRVAGRLEQLGVRGLAVEYGEAVRFTGLVRTERFESVRRSLADQTAGVVEVWAAGERFDRNEPPG